MNRGRLIVLMTLSRIVSWVAVMVTVAWFLGYTGLGAALVARLTP